MIRNNSGKRRPGTINNIQPIKKQIYNQNDDQKLLIYQCRQSRAMAQVNRQQTNKYTKIKNKQIYCDVDLSNKNITNVQKHIDKDLRLACIKKLDVSHNSIVSFPTNIFNKLTDLTEIYLQKNTLQKISFPYFEPNLIRKINISHNQLSSLNLQHLISLQQLECQKNSLTFLTLPQNIKKLNCSSNKLSNIYSIEYCCMVQEVDLSDNMLYDLKLNFFGRLGRQLSSSSIISSSQSHFKCMKYLNCSNNKIQYLQGICHIPNINYFNISNNKLAFTRNIINQLLQLHSISQFDFTHNPIEEAGFSQQEIYQLLCNKLTNIRIINGHDLVDSASNCQIYQQEGLNSARKSHRSFKDQPYCLFMQNSNKKIQNECNNKEWNFTLGDCQPNDQPKQIKLNDLSQIESNHHSNMNETAIDRLNFKLQSKQLQSLPDQIQIKKLLVKEQKQFKLTVVKSTSNFVPHNHVFYQPYLNALLPMSYVPCEPVISRGSKVTAKRLDQQHDDFVLIAKMFQQKGGVVYVKKITAWIIEQNGNALFNGYYSADDSIQMGFLMNEINQKTFKQLTKYGKLIQSSSHDIIGLQPNVFSCYHIIVRYNPQHPTQQYLCSYLIQSSHI